MPEDVKFGQKIQAVPTETPEVGIDVNNDSLSTIIEAAIGGTLNIPALESFSSVTQTREQIYKLIDAMSYDCTLSAVLETYSEDVSETNDKGSIVWCESDNPAVLKYVTFLLNSINVDKHVYSWAYSLIKYGDLYLRLYRQSDYDDDLLFTSSKNHETNIRPARNLTEELHSDEQLARQSNLTEDVNINVYDKNDRYVHYLEMVPNPGEMFELTRFGRTVAYVQAPLNIQSSPADSLLGQNPYLNYTMRSGDVDIYQPDCFVHACLEDNSARTPETVSIIADSQNGEKTLTYQVKRGQSLLYNVARIWRELTLLENSVLLNRLTRSSVVKLIGVEVGDMPKEKVRRHLQSIKQLIEQKVAFKDNSDMTSYTNPGPVENYVYVPTKGGIGALSTQQLGGDVDVKSLLDLEWFNNKLFGALRVPKQYFEPEAGRRFYLSLL